MDGGTLQDIKISLRYDGKDALNHEIDLNCLGESLKGFSKVLSTAASFSATQSIANILIIKKLRCMLVRQKLTVLPLMLP